MKDASAYELFGISREQWLAWDADCQAALIAAGPDEPATTTEQRIRILAEKHRTNGVEFPPLIPVICRFENGSMSLMLWNDGPHFKVVHVGDCCQYFGSCYLTNDTGDEGPLVEPADLYACRNSRVAFAVLRGKIGDVHAHIDDLLAAVGRMNDPREFRLEYKDLLACALLASRAFGN